MTETYVEPSVKKAMEKISPAELLELKQELEKTKAKVEVEGI
jgi:hypothetical protein